MTNLIENKDKSSLLPTSSLGRRIDNLFGDFFSDLDVGFFKHHLFKELKVNISEDGKAYYIEAALPGFEKKDVKLNCKDNMMSIEAKKDEKKEQSGKNFYYTECNCNSFSRTFQIPDHVDISKVDAEMKDGFLNIMLPKTEGKSPLVTDVTIR